MHVLAFLWYLESLNDHREQPGVAHVEPWSRAALGGTAHSSQVRLKKGCRGVPRGRRVWSCSDSSSGRAAKIFGLRIKLENFERSLLPWDLVCFLAPLEPEPQRQNKGFSHRTLLFELKTKLHRERGCWMCPPRWEQTKHFQTVSAEV